jgi:hypothetical protein
MEAVSSSEDSVTFYQTTRHHIREVYLFCLLLGSCLLGVLFDPEDEGSKLILNVGKFLPES